LKSCVNLFAGLALAGLLVVGGCDGQSPAVSEKLSPDDTLTQVSTIDALMSGLYSGVMTLDSLKEYGDFGIGTFADLDGEMLALDGRFYQVKADGIAYLAGGSAQVPFAAVTSFDADQEESLAEGMDFEQFQEYLDGRLPTTNIFYAIRVQGTFSYIKTRSVPAQEKPYPPLSEVTKDQPVFELRDVSGTMVGFRCPAYVASINVPGYHLHFITDGQDAGGHVLEFKVHQASVMIDATSGFLLILPDRDSGFYEVDLSGNMQEEVDKVEK